MYIHNIQIALNTTKVTLKKKMVLSFLQIYSSDNEDESYKGSREDQTSEREWRDKLADEFHYEYQSTWGKYEQGEFAAWPMVLLDSPQNLAM